MFKLLFIGGLVYILYRLVVPNPLPPPNQDNLERNQKIDDEGEYVDYEEIE